MSFVLGCLGVKHTERAWPRERFGALGRQAVLVDTDQRLPFVVSTTDVAVGVRDVYIRETESGRRGTVTSRGRSRSGSRDRSDRGVRGAVRSVRRGHAMGPVPRP
jgi:hypothetical protein